MQEAVSGLKRDAAASADLDRVMATQCEEATNQVLLAQYAKSIPTNSYIEVELSRNDFGFFAGLPIPDHVAASGKAAVNDGEWIARFYQRLNESARGRNWGVLPPYFPSQSWAGQPSATIDVFVPFKSDSSDTAAAVKSIQKLMDEIPMPAGLRVQRFGAKPAHARPPTPAEIAAGKAEEERLAAFRAAPPAQLASKDLVRKSRRYWLAYRTDLIREIFDGGFGDGIGDDEKFQYLFCAYVEVFSKDYRDALPARHETVSFQQTEDTIDRYGTVVRSRTLQDWSVECDSRFAPYYRDCIKRANSLFGQGPLAMHTFKQLLTGGGLAMYGAGLNILMEPEKDIERFIATEKPRSAAVRQLGENLLRAAEDKLSLQQAGEKIAGAAAESDPDVPPGKYVRFIDGCNGFFRDPKNARFAGPDTSAWCDCLAKKYEHAMRRDEEYYYANDFKKRFIDQIVLPQGTDPNWQRLSPATRECEFPTALDYLRTATTSTPAPGRVSPAK